MSQPLPLSRFIFLNIEQIEYFDYKSISVKGNVGNIMKVDLEYPTDRQDLHKYLPFCPENKVPPGGKQKKRKGDLTNRSEYIIHFNCKKIHKVLSFTQSC